MQIEIIQPSATIVTPLEGLELHIERCGRVCYKSEDRITDGSAEKFVRMICRNQHESVLEHANATVIFKCSRSASHQLVRHRAGCSYSQESQRYVNYSKKGYQLVCPPSIGLEPGVYTRGSPLEGVQKDWVNLMFDVLTAYEVQLSNGVKPEDARYVLPNAAKTEIAVTCNMRAWRHIFRERALNSHAQWEIRGLMLGLLEQFEKELPSIFKDLRN